MVKNEVTEASELFGKGLYCSQAVLMAFCEKYGMDKGTALKISCGLNSGARCAEICGAVSGAVLVIGLRYGDSSVVCNEKTEEFMNLFKNRYGNIVCRDILGCDISTPEGKKKATEDHLFGKFCVSAVANAAQTLVVLGY
ncbi:MAG: C-GCAxxG-C-C family protein [Methanomassiliicoccaceae archaeon]|nr:C-GCAxxG-C-C family protein [Methanomassiliicoccaceae archaeon]